MIDCYSYDILGTYFLHQELPLWNRKWEIVGKVDRSNIPVLKEYDKMTFSNIFVLTRITSIFLITSFLYDNTFSVIQRLRNWRQVGKKH